MAYEVSSFTELTSENTVQTRGVLSALVEEANPNLDVRRGVLKGLLMHFSALLAEKNAEELSRLRRSGSLLEIEADPTLAEDDAVDKIASNYRVTRNTGAKASGSVHVLVTRLEPITIPAGSRWEADGRQFVTNLAFASKTSSASVVTSTDRVMTPVGDGTYRFTIDVVAVEVGESSAIKKDTAVIPQEPPLSFQSAYAAADFIGGVDAETNAELIERLINGMATKGLSGSVHMGAALRAETAFENVLDDSVIGFGDGEMLRDQHSIFPGSRGGRVDWYIRTQRRPQVLGLTKTATLVEKTEDGYGIWQFGIGRDEAPGFYRVLNLRIDGEATSVGSFEITANTRQTDLTEIDNDGFLPDIADPIEAAYSRFQTAVVQFKDDRTATSGLTVGSSTQVYAMNVQAMPLIADIQDWAAGRGVRNRAGDILVKAPVPCFLRISFDVELKPGTATPDVDQIRADIAELVNTYGFTGRLPASAISDVVHDSLSGIQYLSAVDMLGDIYRPDGTVRRIRSTETLVVPTEESRMVTSRTVAFIVDPADIAITVLTADIALV